MEIVSISTDSSVADINTFRAKRWPVPSLNGWVPGRMNGAQFRDYDVYALPRASLIGPDGIILAAAEELRGAALGATLRRVLSPSGSPK